MYPESVDVRRILVREGLKLELENQFIQLQEYTINLEQKHFAEREEMAKFYLHECEKSSKLQHQVDTMEVELDSLRGQLKEKKKKEDSLIDTVNELETEKDIWKSKCKKSEEMMESYQLNISELKIEVLQLTINQQRFENSIEKGKSPKLRHKKNNR